MNKMKRVTCYGVFALKVEATSQRSSRTKRRSRRQIARQVVAAAEQAAVANHNHMFIFIVDDGGNLMDMERMDDAQRQLQRGPGGARSAVFFKRPTKMLRTPSSRTDTPRF